MIIFDKYHWFDEIDYSSAWWHEVWWTMMKWILLVNILILLSFTNILQKLSSTKILIMQYLITLIKIICMMEFITLMNPSTWEHTILTLNKFIMLMESHNLDGTHLAKFIIVMKFIIFMKVIILIQFITLMKFIDLMKFITLMKFIDFVK